MTMWWLAIAVVWFLGRGLSFAKGGHEWEPDELDEDDDGDDEPEAVSEDDRKALAAIKQSGLKPDELVERAKKHREQEEKAKADAAKTKPADVDPNTPLTAAQAQQMFDALTARREARSEIENALAAATGAVNESWGTSAPAWQKESVNAEILTRVRDRADLATADPKTLQRELTGIAAAVMKEAGIKPANEKELERRLKANRDVGAAAGLTRDDDGVDEGDDERTEHRILFDPKPEDHGVHYAESNLRFPTQADLDREDATLRRKMAGKRS